MEESTAEETSEDVLRLQRVNVTEEGVQNDCPNKRCEFAAYHLLVRPAHLNNQWS